MRKVKGLIILLLCITCATVTMADINWYNTNSELITDYDGSSLANSTADYTVGVFAQLIKASSSTAGSFDVNNAQGVSSGDSVVGQNFSCQGAAAIPSFAGYFPQQTLSTDQSGYYYVRVFNAPQQNATDWGNAVVPTTATYYWESEVYSYSYSMSPTDWNFTDGSSDLKTSNPITAVPEPTTLAFLGLGVVAFVVRKRVRS